MITEDYVSFETAKLLKEKGFNAELHMYWGFYPTRPSEGYIVRCPEDKEVDNTCSLGFSPDDFECIAPTLQMAMKWLREVHNIDVCVCREIDEYGDCFDGYIAVVYSNKVYKVTIRDVEKDLSFEEAAEEGIKYCLTNLI